MSDPTETSPLLPKPNKPVDAGNGIASRYVEGYDEERDVGSSEEQGDADGGHIERHASNGETTKHQGMPEVRKRMKYIFPAVAIGVSRYLIRMEIMIATKTSLGIFGGCGPDFDCFYIWSHWI